MSKVALMGARMQSKIFCENGTEPTGDVKKRIIEEDKIDVGNDSV